MLCLAILQWVNYSDMLSWTQLAWTLSRPNYERIPSLWIAEFILLSVLCTVCSSRTKSYVKEAAGVPSWGYVKLNDF